MNFIGKHQGQEAIICGSAPCLLDEFNLVRSHRPNSIVFAVNDAAAAVEAHYLATLEPRKVGIFKEKSLNKNIITLSGKNIPNCGFDYFIEGCLTNATSTYSAVMMARLMGFKEIIICGAPMDASGGYFFRPANLATFFKMMSFGDAPAESAMMRRYRDTLLKASQEEDVSMVRSCSGFTAEVFGKPEF